MLLVVVAVFTVVPTFQYQMQKRADARLMVELRVRLDEILSEDR